MRNNSVCRVLGPSGLSVLLFLALTLLPYGAQADYPFEEASLAGGRDSDVAKVYSRIHQAVSAKAASVKVAPEEVNVAMDGCRAALDSVDPDWAAYRMGAFVLLHAEEHQADTVPIARLALEAPRGEKISDQHGAAILDAVRLIPLTATEDAAKLLMRMTEASYWGEDFRARPIATDPRIARITLQSQAILGLGDLPPSLALPALQKLAEKCPNRGAVALPESEYRFQDGAGFLIQQEIWEVKKRAGMDVGPSPREVALENSGPHSNSPASAAE